MNRVCCLFAGGHNLKTVWGRWPELGDLSFELRAQSLHFNEEQVKLLHNGFRIRSEGVIYRLEWFKVTET